uniref:Uncharacterized protein n=1 Tax=Aegilops tauschii TaxID=37682 RepID=M8BQY7_AEGTA
MDAPAMGGDAMGVLPEGVLPSASGVLALHGISPRLEVWMVAGAAACPETVAEDLLRAADPAGAAVVACSSTHAWGGSDDA